MSGINLLLNTAIDYERTHQIALYTLLTKSQFPKIWLGTPTECKVQWEPERQLFDLLTLNGDKRIYIELKMWSSLGDDQFKRQIDFLEKNRFKAVYVLLGTSWFEYTANKIAEYSKGLASKIGYEELLEALNTLLVQSDQSPDVYELALAYRNSLQAQFKTLTNAALNSSAKNKLFYYSLFWMLQKRLPKLQTAIYTANNPGGPVYIFNNSVWQNISIKGVAVQLYYEIVNDRLCIKFFTEADNDKKLAIRTRLREVSHSVLDTPYTVIDSGRLGAYMTACQIDWDFSNTSKLEDSARLFADIHNKLKKIADQL